MRAVTGLVCLLSVTPLRAEILEIAPRFAVNQKIEMEISGKREDSALRMANGGNVATVVATVKEVTAQGALLEWVSSEARLDNPEQLKDPLSVAGAKVLAGIPVSVRFSPNGSSSQFTNLDATRERFKKSAAEVIEKVAAGIASEAERKKFQDAAPKVLTFEAALRAYAEDLSAWTIFNGLSLEPGKPVKTKIVGPHPIDVGKIASELELTSDLALEKKEFSLKGQQTYDPNGFVGMLRPLLRQSQVAFTPKAGHSPEIQMADQFDFVFDTDHGWAKRASRTRTVNIDTLLKRSDNTTIVIKSVTESK